MHLAKERFLQQTNQEPFTARAQGVWAEATAFQPIHQGDFPDSPVSQGILQDCPRPCSPAFPHWGAATAHPGVAHSLTHASATGCLDTLGHVSHSRASTKAVKA